MRIALFLVPSILAKLPTATLINSTDLDNLFEQAHSPLLLRSSASRGVNLRDSTLFKALNGNPPPSNFEVIRTHEAGDVTVLSGLLRDESGAIIGDAVVARRASNGWALVASHSNELESVKIQGSNAEGSELEYDVTPRHADSEDNDHEFVDEVTDSEGLLLQSASHRVDWREGAEMDATGNVVIDVLCAIHSAAMADAGNDVDGTCTAMMESLNLALTLSGVEGVRMRVVAAMQEDPQGYTGPINPNGEFLNAVKQQFAGRRAEFGADHVIYLTTGREGLAHRPGWLAVGGVRALSVMRHEVGHNMNISHCPDDSAAYFGHLVAETGRGTIMCGNHIPVFASSDLADMGYAAGRTAKSDIWKQSSESNAVNAWLRNAAAHSAFMPHVFPYEAEERVDIIPKQEVLWHKATGMDRPVSFVAPQNAQQVMVLVVASTDYPQGAPELYVTKEAPKLTPTAPSDYEYHAAKHWKSGSNYILIKDPIPEQVYHIVIDDDIANVDTTGYEIRVWAFRIPYVTTTTTIALSTPDQDVESTTTTTTTTTTTPTTTTTTTTTTTPTTTTTTTTPTTTATTTTPTPTTHTTTTSTTTTTRTKIDLDTAIELITTAVPRSITGGMQTTSTLYYQTVAPWLRQTE